MFGHDVREVLWQATTLGAGNTLRLPDSRLEVPVAELYQDVDLLLPEQSVAG